MARAMREGEGGYPAQHAFVLALRADGWRAEEAAAVKAWRGPACPRCGGCGPRIGGRMLSLREDFFGAADVIAFQGARWLVAQVTVPDRVAEKKRMLEETFPSGIQVAIVYPDRRASAKGKTLLRIEYREAGLWHEKTPIDIGRFQVQEREKKKEKRRGQEDLTRKIREAGYDHPH